jgi:hypothetical protein
MVGEANSNYRLGPRRRNLRDYSIKLRCAGLTAADLQNMKDLKRIMGIQSLAILNSQQRIQQLQQQSIAYPELSTLYCAEIDQLKPLHEISQSYFLLSWLHLASRYWTPRLPTPDAIEHRQVTFDYLTNQEYEQYLGFSKDDCRQLYDVLQFPQRLKLNRRTTVDPNGRRKRHSFTVSGIHAFLYTLFRFRSPSKRMTLDEKFWGYDYSVLSRMFHRTVSWIDQHHGHRLNNLDFIRCKLPTFNRKIVMKMEEKFHGHPLPIHITNCSLFIDGTRFRIAKPYGPGWQQQLAYSGDHKCHCHGCQAVMGPDGIIYDWYDRPYGRYSDKHFYSDSGINTRIRNLQLGNARQFWAYGDKAYNSRSHVRGAYHGRHLTQQQRRANYMMSGKRIAAEWAFSKIKSRCPFVQQSWLLKLRAMDVAATVRVAVLLTNAHSCIHHNETSLYFDCRPPSLQQYFQ